MYLLATVAVVPVAVSGFASCGALRSSVLLQGHSRVVPENDDPSCDLLEIPAVRSCSELTLLQPNSSHSTVALKHHSPLNATRVRVGD
jgi:hypothetical protein